MKGYFLVLEGPDGSGKTTAIENIAAGLKNLGYTVSTTREPGGTSIGEQIRDILLDTANTAMGYRTEALLYSAARAQIVDQFIRPKLKKGHIVICDRYVLSTLAYQGGARGQSLEDLITVNNYAMAGTVPDRTIFLDLDPKIGIRRKTKQEKLDRLEKESLEFHNDVYSTYKELIKEYPYPISVIDGNLSIDKIYELCMNIIMEDIQ